MLTLGVHFSPQIPDVGLPPLVEQCPWARDVSHWKPLPVRAVIATRISSVCTSPCRATDRGSACANFLGMDARSLSRCAYLRCRIRGSALYFFRDRRCADRQRHLVIDERELMGENILPDLGIQEALTGNQGIYRTE